MRPNEVSAVESSGTEETHELSNKLDSSSCDGSTEPPSAGDEILLRAAVSTSLWWLVTERGRLGNGAEDGAEDEVAKEVDSSTSEDSRWAGKQAAIVGLFLPGRLTRKEDAGTLERAISPC